MGFKDWKAFLASKDAQKVKQASSDNKLLLSKMDKDRKQVYDAVIGPTLLAEYAAQIDSCNGVNYDVIKIDRFFDNVENECTKLFTALKETDQSILNKMLLCLKVFLTKNEFVHYNTSWGIIMYVLNKNFNMSTSYQYFCYLVLNIFPRDYFNYKERCLVSHQYLRVFGLFASEMSPTLLTALSITKSIDPKQPQNLDQQQEQANQKVDDIGIISEKKTEIKNRTAFFNLCDKVGEIYLNGLMLAVIDHSCILQLLDLLLFKGFHLLMKLSLKTFVKNIPKADKLAKNEVAQCNKLKQPIDLDIMKSISEKCYAVFSCKVTNSDFNTCLKQTLEDNKLDTLCMQSLDRYLKLALSEQVANESQLNFNRRIHQMQYLRQQQVQLQGLRDDNCTLQVQLQKITSISKNNTINRQQLMSMFQDKQVFMFSKALAMKFDQLLAQDDYGQVDSKLVTVLVSYILITDMPVDEKLGFILQIFGIQEGQELSMRQVLSLLVMTEMYLDPRQKILEIEQLLIEKVEGEQLFTKKNIIDSICTQPVFNGIQSLLLSIEMDFQKVPSMAHFQEIYNRPTPNTSFVKYEDDNDDLNISKMSRLSGNDNINAAELNDINKQEKDRDCACSIF